MHGVSWKLLLVVVGLIAVSTGQITQPRNCNQWFSGYDYNIVWNPSSFTGEFVVLDLYNNGAFQETIAVVENTGVYRWLVPYKQLPYNYGCASTIIITSADDTENSLTSGAFTLSNPIVFGDAYTAIRSPFNVADTLVKIRWSGVEVPLYVIQYHQLGSAVVHQISHPLDRAAFESLDDHVISGLLANTTYEFRMSYFMNNTSPIAAWTTWVPFVTYPDLDCSDEMLSAWFSQEVYDNIRTGEHKYPGFCGDWETAFAFIRSPDYGAIYVERNTGKVIVAYRGTVFGDAADANENLGILVPCNNYIAQTDSNCAISSGFALGYANTGTSSVYRSLIESFIDQGYYDLVVTGHSQGAAIATIAYADYASRYAGVVAVSAYTFGSPQPGNEVFGNIVASYGSLTRVVMFDEEGTPDEVTLLPSSAAGYVPAYFTDGFFQIPVTPLTLPCPALSSCRTSGDTITPPYYCHCIRGYWGGSAALNILLEFSSTTYSTDYAIYVEEEESPFEGKKPPSAIPSDSVAEFPFSSEYIVYYYNSRNSAAALLPFWALIAVFSVMLF